MHSGLELGVSLSSEYQRLAKVLWLALNGASLDKAVDEAANKFKPSDISSWKSVSSSHTLDDDVSATDEAIVKTTEFLTVAHRGDMSIRPSKDNSRTIIAQTLMEGIMYGLELKTMFN